MAGKLIYSLDARNPGSTDVVATSGPSSGAAGKSTVAAVVAAGLTQAAILPTPSSLAYTSATTGISANTDNLALSTATLHRLNVTAGSNLTGIAPPAGLAHADGRLLVLVNTGTSSLSLRHQDAGSVAANQLYSHNGSNLNMQVGHLVFAVYDATLSKWRVWMIS